MFDLTLYNVVLFKHTLQLPVSYQHCVLDQPFDVDAVVDAAGIGPIEPEHTRARQVFALGQKLLQL